MPLAALIGPVLGALGGASVLVPAAAGIGGALIASHGASSAASTQAAASTAAAQAELEAAREDRAQRLGMYNQTRTDLSPWLNFGGSAISQLAGIFGLNGGGPDASKATSALTQFPGFQFGRDQGIQALDHSGSARGLALSGSQLKDVSKFGTDYAMQQAWNPYISALSGFSTQGQNAAAGLGTLGFNTGQGIGQALQYGGNAAATGITGAGTANASGQVAGANSLSQALQNSVLAYQLSRGGGGGGYGGVSPLGSVSPYGYGDNSFSPMAVNSNVPGLSLPNFPNFAAA